MATLDDHIREVRACIERTETSLNAFEDGTMHLLQGPPGNVQDITAQYVADLKTTKATYEKILADLLART